jgi:hypothetical protein
MGMIINIDQALKNREEFNILGEPLHQMMRDRQEAWEKENPIDLLFVRGTLDGFQETYSSSIGFEHAFAETGDYAVGPIFNTADGFSATYTSRTFQGGFIITQQVIEDRKFGKVKDEATKFQTRWHGDVVEYCMKSLDGAFGTATTWGSAANGGVSRIKLESADTVDGDIMNPNKNPLFSKQHTIVKRNADTDIAANYQSNMFYIEGLDIDGDDAARISKLADGINQIITIMENYKDDNGKYAGVSGAKSIVAANDAHLKAALNNALQTDKFNQGESITVNPAYQRASVATTPYLNDILATKGGAGFFIVDKAYNEANHGLEFTERIPFTLDATETKRPKGITYDGRQRFDVNNASWRGIAYVRIAAPTSGDFAAAKFTTITPAATVATIMKTVEA